MRFLADAARTLETPKSSWANLIARIKGSNMGMWDSVTAVKNHYLMEEQMARLTKALGNQEGYWVDIGAIEKTKGGYTGEAIAKLAILENILDDLTANQADLTEQLDILRNEDKTKTVRFKEMMGQKLINNMMVTHFKKYGLE